MSYDISLCDPVTKETLLMDSPHQIKGGTYAVGGTNEMWLNITYYGMSGAESIPILKMAISTLETCNDNLSEEEQNDYAEHGVTGYWIPTRENAIRPLYQLLAFAQMRPDGVWRGD